MEKSRHAKAEYEYATQNKELLGKIDEALREGAKKNAEKLADKALPRVMCLYWLIALAIVALFLFVGCILILKINKGELPWFPEVYNKTSVVIDAMVEVIIACVGYVVFTKVLCGLDRNAVRDMLIAKYMR